jgi:SAM-dependent methyltransferase
MTDFRYVGSELDLFAAALNWKRYWSERIRPYLSGDVLEVGSGIGANAPVLDRGGIGRWVCLEPDPQLMARLAWSLDQRGGGRRYQTVCGTLATLDAGEQFDTIIYLDVLEHIQNDRGELSTAALRLRPGGRIIVLSPAHQWLFTPFDAAIGHFRRYNRAMLQAISPASLEIEQLIYLDSVGLTASVANRILLRRSMPTKGQLRFWDNWMIPVSRVLDKLLLYSVGKSIIAVWRKPVSV